MAGAAGIFPWESVAAYEAHMLCQAEGATEVYAEVAGALKLKGAALLLDLLCGTGRELDAVLKRTPWIGVTGIDPSPGFLAKLLAKPYASRLTLINGTGLEVDLGNAVYDAAVSCFAVQFFPAEDRALLYRKVCDSLRPGGRYVEAGVYRGGTEETASLLRGAGFAHAQVHWKKDDRAILMAGKDARI